MPPLAPPRNLSHLVYLPVIIAVGISGSFLISDMPLRQAAAVAASISISLGIFTGLESLREGWSIACEASFVALLAIFLAAPLGYLGLVITGDSRLEIYDDSAPRHIL